MTGNHLSKTTRAYFPPVCIIINATTFSQGTVAPGFCKPGWEASAAENFPKNQGRLLFAQAVNQKRQQQQQPFNEKGNRSVWHAYSNRYPRG